MGIDDFIRDLERLSQKLSTPEIVVSLGNRLVNNLANSLGASGLKQQTGNLYKGIIAISEPEKTSAGYAIGVGNLNVLGSETDLTPPNTIRDFLSFLTEVKLAEGNRRQARALQVAQIRQSNARSRAAKRGARTKAAIKREVSKATASERQAARSLARYEAITAAKQARISAEQSAGGFLAQEGKGPFAGEKSFYNPSEGIYTGRIDALVAKYGVGIKQGIKYQTTPAHIKAARLYNRLAKKAKDIASSTKRLNNLQVAIQDRLKQARKDKRQIESALAQHTAEVVARYRSRK
jgi:hypothetical protein